MNFLLKIVIGIIGGLLAILGLGWLGLQVRPRPFEPVADESADLGTIPLPTDLPAPVYRHFQIVFGDEVPVVKTAVIQGRPRVRINGIWLPVRYTSYFNAGYDYQRDMEVTIYGVSIGGGYERYAEGTASAEIFGQVEPGGKKLDQAANLAVWAEGFWTPSIFITDERIRWEPVSDTQARVYFPFDDGEDSLLLTFDPETGLMTGFQAMRYRGSDSSEKIGWRGIPEKWERFDGVLIPSESSIVWADEGTSWATWTVENVQLNVDVSAKLTPRP